MIYLDHKPLQHIFNESKGMPIMASVHIQQWALVLSAYTDNIVFKPGRQNANADVLSCLSLPDSPDDVPLPEKQFYYLYLEMPWKSLEIVWKPETE